MNKKSINKLKQDITLKTECRAVDTYIEEKKTATVKMTHMAVQCLTEQHNTWTESLFESVCACFNSSVVPP